MKKLIIRDIMASNPKPDYAREEFYNLVVRLFDGREEISGLEFLDNVSIPAHERARVLLKCGFFKPHTVVRCAYEIARLVSHLSQDASVSETLALVGRWLAGEPVGSELREAGLAATKAAWADTEAAYTDTEAAYAAAHAAHAAAYAAEGICAVGYATDAVYYAANAIADAADAVYYAADASRLKSSFERAALDILRAALC